MTAQTVMAEAFSAARAKASPRQGPQTAAERLKSIMRQAILDGIGHESPALGHFERALGRDPDEAILLRALIGNELLRSVAARLYYDTKNEIRLEQSSLRGSGQWRGAGDAGLAGRAAPAKPSRDDRSDQDVCVDNVGQNNTVAAVAPSPPAEATPRSSAIVDQTGGTSPAEKLSYHPQGALRSVINYLYLRDFRISVDGVERPLGKCTADEALAWSKKTKRDARFVELLCEGLPPNAIIEDSKSEADAKRARKLAASDC